MKQSKVIFPKKKVAKKIFDTISKEQTSLLITYAESQIQKIGQRMQAWEDKGNLLDSLCWGLFYNGNLRRLGYYREGGAYDTSYLHALSKSIRTPVNGHESAQFFLSEYNPKVQKGWEVVWAVAAPYWGYWEKGHRNVMLGDSFVKFSIMSQRWDVIRKQLKPAKVSFHTYVPRYAKQKV